MRPIETSTGDFADFRIHGGIYVDKTAYFHRLVKNRNSRFLFLARPRRFGKSLMITALKAIFQGRRELFDGLDISRTNWEWEKWPVIHFDFSEVDATGPEAFDVTFTAAVKRRLADTGFAYDDMVPPSVNFGAAIDSLSSANGGRGAVVLIDEYDAPVSHALDDIAFADVVRKRMSAFYSVMKPANVKKMALLLSSHSPGVYDSAVTEYKLIASFCNYEDTGVVTACADEHKTEDTKQKILELVNAL